MRVTLTGLLQAAAALAMALSVATVFDALHHRIELFVHFRLQYLVAALLAAIALIALRHYAWGGVLLLTAACNAYFLLPFYPGPSATSDGDALTVMQVNVHASNKQHRRVVDVVLEESPDVVLLLEVTEAWMSGTRELADRYEFHYSVPREDNFGIAVYSRVPFDTVEHVGSPPLAYPTLVAEARVAGRSVTLIGTHPTIPVSRRGFDARNEHLDSVARLAAQAGESVILIGDLNVTPWAHSFRRFAQQSGLRDARLGIGVVPTWPTFIPFAMIPIDHALVSDDIRVLDLRRGARTGSDHLPLVLTVAL